MTPPEGRAQRSAAASATSNSVRTTRSTRSKVNGDPEAAEVAKPFTHPIFKSKTLARLDIGIDAGTRNSAVYINQVGRDAGGLDHRTALHSTHAVSIGDRMINIPSEAAIIPDDTKKNGNSYKLIFGDDIQGAFEQRELTPKQVIRFLKLSLTDQTMKNLDKKYHGMLRDIKDAQNAALAPFLGQKVNVYSALTKQASEVTITDVRPVLVEFLKFLLDLAKLSVRNVSGFKVVEVVAMFKVARVAIACPVSWTDSQIDELAVNLEEAGYPDNTIIASEAMANAVFHLVDKAKKGQPELKKFLGIENKQITKGILRKLALVVCDVGHGTTDLASIAVKRLEPFVQLAEIVSGKGSLSGSQRLTNIFANFVHKNRSGDLRSILSEMECTEQELLAGLCDHFERIKPRLDVERTRTLVRSDIWYHNDTGVIESEPAGMTLFQQEMSCIVDDWCQEIVSLIESQIARTKNQDPEIEYVEVFLSGGGSQSRALQAVVRHQLASEEVKVSVSDADSDRSAVAQGNLWALLDEGELCRPKYARVSYGIPLDVRYESDNSNHVEAELIHGLSVGRFHVERYLVNSIHWTITMDDEVKGETIEGTITATDELDNFNEITLMQEVLWSSHGEVARKSEAFSATTELQKGTVTSCGFLRLEVGSAEDAGFEVLEEGNLKSFTVDFKAEIQHKGVLPHWVFSVPRGGTWQRSKLYEAGQQCFTARMSLKNMREVQAQVNAKKQKHACRYTE